MKKIAYIELDTHAEIASNFWELMKNSQKFSVDYYFSEKILKILGQNTAENVFMVSERTLLSQLHGKNYDLVIIGTAHRYFNIWERVVSQFHTAIIGHNLHFIQSSNMVLLQNLFKKDWKFRLKLLLKEGLLSKNKVYQNARSVFVLDEKLAVSRFLYLPLFFNQIFGYLENERLKIVIPGAVSQKRRDYFRIKKDLLCLKTEKKIEVVFLGKVEGEELVWLKDLERKLGSESQMKITYFTEKVPQKKFDEEMKKADVLYSPIQVETEFFSVKERYGETKMSGNIGDAIRFGKKMILPQHYSDERFFVGKEEAWADFIEKNQKTKESDWQKFKKEEILLDLEKILLISCKT